MTAAGLPVRGGPVTRLFLTHLHSDHTLGYPDLIFTSWVMGRRHPLQVVGPPGTRAMTDHLLAAWAQDIRVRTGGLEQEPADGYKVQVREARDGIVYDSANVRVAAFQVPHGSVPVSLAYRLQTPGATIVISGDTRPSPALEAMASGADLLFHEVYPEARVAPEPRPGGEHWPKLNLLETMGVILREEHELDYLTQVLPRWETTFPENYRVELQLNDSVKKVLRSAPGWHPPTVLFHFVDSAADGRLLPSGDMP